MIKLIECPRDAMQGIKEFIPTEKKIAYLNSLLRVGFHTLDFGSFVSPRAIPQLSDTMEVLNKINIDNTLTKLLAIVANVRGAQDAVEFDEISYLGFPFSISETFQRQNTNSSIEESLGRVEDIQDLCVRNKKELVIYISMAFGNPYGDEWNSDIVIQWIEKIYSLGVRIIALADTTGVSSPQSITYLFSHLIPHFKDVEFGAHLHSHPNNWKEKVEAAYKGGCKRFDSAIHGFGGCPMAQDKLVGNIATENIVEFFSSLDISLDLNKEALKEAYQKAWEVFPKN